MSTATMVQGERSANQREALDERTFPWERLPGESIQAYRRFMQYRLMPPGERSLRQLEIAYTLAARWAKRWRWTARTAAYDDHVSECIDGLSTTAQLGSRLRQARLGSAFARQAERKLSEVKLTSVDDLVNLATTGVKLNRQALGLQDAAGDTRAERAPLAQVAISLGSTPPWLTSPITNASENEQKEVGLIGGKVLGEGIAVPAQRPEAKSKVRLAEKIVKSPKSGNK